jgi:ubiquinone/menaquinone biosynthesis C-methylase UbiE
MRSTEEITILKQAIQHHLQDEFNLALNGYIEYLKHHPSDVHANNLLGILLIQNGLHEHGEVYMKRFLELKNSGDGLIENILLFADSSAAKINQEIHSIKLFNEYSKSSLDTVDAWRHLRMLDFVDCFVGGNDQWLTVGDSVGHDTRILKQMGVKSVVSSNLDSQNLDSAKKAGAIDEYLTINAESIDLPSNSYDYVLCKESLHHMPRPYLAVYEMLRISRKGVFFIDPQDSYIDWPAKKSGFYREMVPDNLVGEKISFRKSDDDQEIYRAAVDWWEDEAFNYVYTFSKREIRKIALGMGLPFYAVKCFNDWYEPGLGEELVSDNGPGFKKTKEQIALHDQVCSIMGKPSTYITGLLFKKTPSPTVRNALSKLNYSLSFTPTRFLPIEWPRL